MSSYTAIPGRPPHIPPHQDPKEYVLLHLPGKKMKLGRKVRAGLMVGIPVALTVILAGAAILVARVPTVHHWSQAHSIVWPGFAAGAATTGSLSLVVGLLLYDYHAKKSLPLPQDRYEG